VQSHRPMEAARSGSLVARSTYAARRDRRRALPGTGPRRPAKRAVRQPPVSRRTRFRRRRSRRCPRRCHFQSSGSHRPLPHHWPRPSRRAKTPSPSCRPPSSQSLRHPRRPGVASQGCRRNMRRSVWRSQTETKHDASSWSIPYACFMPIVNTGKAVGSCRDALPGCVRPPRSRSLVSAPTWAVIVLGLEVSHE
jgi:hypothetical protein